MCPRTIGPVVSFVEGRGARCAESFASRGENHPCRLPLTRAIQTRMERIRIEQHSWTGTLWAFGWLFTIGYLHPTFWKGVLALLLWPYYLGLTFSALH